MFHVKNMQASEVILFVCLFLFYSQVFPNMVIAQKCWSPLKCNGHGQTAQVWKFRMSRYNFISNCPGFESHLKHQGWVSLILIPRSSQFSSDYRDLGMPLYQLYTCLPKTTSIFLTTLLL